MKIFALFLSAVLALTSASDDRAEQKNLAAMHSDIVRELQAKLEGWKASLPRESPANCLSEKRSKKPKAKAK